MGLVPRNAIGVRFEEGGGVKFWYGKGYEKGKLVVFGLLIGYDVHVSENL